MILIMTTEEREKCLKRYQIAFMITQDEEFKSMNRIYKNKRIVNAMSDNEIEEKYILYEDRIKKMWVECCPNYLHITEFEEELNDQLSYIYHSWKDVVTQRTYDRIHDFYKEINKSHFDELTIEEKVRLFQIIQPERY